MKPNIIRSIAVCLTAIVLSLMMACSSQEESLQPPENSHMAVFTLNLGNLSDTNTHAITRADEEFQQGVGLENSINLSGRDFRCYLFDSEDKFVSELFTGAILTNQEQGTYKVLAKLEDDETTNTALKKGCKFMFLANWSTYSSPITGITTIGDICSSSQFDFNKEKSQLSTTNLIPMFGVTNEMTVTLNEQEPTDIGTIYILRAYAKVEVNVTFCGFKGSPQVDNISITKTNNKGYKAPSVTSESAYVNEDGNMKVDELLLNIPNNVSIDEDGMILKRVSDDSWCYELYIPEYKNEDEGATKLQLSCTNGTVTKSWNLDFKYTSGENIGGRFDIKRNTKYIFNITITPIDFNCIVDVIPFSEVVLKPDFGLDREPISGFLKGKDSNGNDCWYDANYYEDEEGKSDVQPLYLGTKEHPGEPITVNDKKYLLVYADGDDYTKPIYNSDSQVTGYEQITGFERRASTLSVIIDITENKRYNLTPAAITGYELGNDMYLNNLKQRVWLDGSLFPNPPSNESIDPPAYIFRSHRIIFEWDRYDWNKAYWWRWPGVYPKHWFDVFGNRYSWEEGDTKEKREAILGEWANYLED